MPLQVYCQSCGPIVTEKGRDKHVKAEIVKESHEEQTGHTVNIKPEVTA